MTGPDPDGAQYRPLIARSGRGTEEAAILALSAGGAGWVLARRGSLTGRRLLSAFAGMALAAAVIAVLALAAH